jgi:hypothetical protein
MACTHTELSKFARPDEARFEGLWDQLDIVVDNAAKRGEQVREEARRLAEAETTAKKKDHELHERLANLRGTEALRDEPS